VRKSALCEKWIDDVEGGGVPAENDEARTHGQGEGVGVGVGVAVGVGVGVGVGVAVGVAVGDPVGVSVGAGVAPGRGSVTAPLSGAKSKHTRRQRGPVNSVCTDHRYATRFFPNLISRSGTLTDRLL
jgi:hypothetical protein